MTGTATLACSACGTVSFPGDQFCEVCGDRLGPPADRREAIDEWAAGATDRGRRRRRNEDAFALFTTTDDQALAVLCDGVSTTADAHEAAQQGTAAALAALIRSRPDEHPDDVLAAAYVDARSAVRQIPWSDGGDIGPPSCTFLAAAVTGYRVELASIGDCRAYWIPKIGEPQLLTEDDSWAAEQAASATMTAAEAYGDARSSGITRWIGADADPSWEPRRVRFNAPADGQLVLCSDGLWNYARGAPELAAAAGYGDALSVARRLIDYANRRGGHDNITVVVVELPRREDGIRHLRPKESGSQ